MSIKNINKEYYFQYAILAFPISFASLPIYIHTPYLYSTQYGISLASLGAIMIISRLFDALQDPLIGYFSDKYNRYRKTILILGSAVLLLSVFGLFHKPLFNPHLWLIIFLFLSTSSYSIIVINYNTLGALCSDDKFERTRITTNREAFGLVGLIAASAAPTILQNHFHIVLAFEYFSWMFIIISFICSLIFFSWYSSKNIAEITNNNRTILNKQLIYNILKDKKFFYSVFFVSSLASSIPSVLVLFFIKEVLNLSSYSGLFLLLYFLSGALCMPIWKNISNQFGKLKTWIFAMLVAIVTFIWAFFLEEGQIIEYSFVCLLSGASLGCELSLPPSILADLAGNRKENITINFSILAFLTKLSLALSSGLILYLLSLSAFIPGQINSEHAIYWLSFYYAIIPCIMKIVAIFIALYWGSINAKA